MSNVEKTGVEGSIISHFKLKAFLHFCYTCGRLFCQVNSLETFMTSFRHDKTFSFSFSRYVIPRTPLTAELEELKKNVSSMASDSKVS